MRSVWCQRGVPVAEGVHRRERTIATLRDVLPIAGIEP
jgi:hypothetical protein